VSATPSTGVFEAGSWALGHLDGLATLTVTGTVASIGNCTTTASLASSVPATDEAVATQVGGQATNTPTTTTSTPGGTSAVECPTEPHGFVDVDPDSFAEMPIRCIKGLGITTGTSDTTYSPDNPVTRAQMAAFVSRTWEALGGECAATPHGFADVDPSGFAEMPIRCIKALGITTGTSDTTYSPTDNVTRAQMAAFISRTWEALGNDCPDEPHGFVDVDPSGFAEAPIRCIKALGITTGTSDTTYSPTDNVTRAQMAAFISRLITAHASAS
jgi:hypothetical protein